MGCGTIQHPAFQCLDTYTICNNQILLAQQFIDERRIDPQVAEFEVIADTIIQTYRKQSQNYIIIKLPDTMELGDIMDWYAEVKQVTNAVVRHMTEGALGGIFQSQMDGRIIFAFIGPQTETYFSSSYFGTAPPEQKLVEEIVLTLRKSMRAGQTISGLFFDPRTVNNQQLKRICKYFNTIIDVLKVRARMPHLEGFAELIPFGIICILFDTEQIDALWSEPFPLSLRKRVNVSPDFVIKWGQKLFLGQLVLQPDYGELLIAIGYAIEQGIKEITLPKHIKLKPSDITVFQYLLYLQFNQPIKLRQMMSQEGPIDAFEVTYFNNQEEFVMRAHIFFNNLIQNLSIANDVRELYRVPAISVEEAETPMSIKSSVSMLAVMPTVIDQSIVDNSERSDGHKSGAGPPPPQIRSREGRKATAILSPLANQNQKQDLFTIGQNSANSGHDALLESLLSPSEPVMNNALRQSVQFQQDGSTPKVTRRRRVKPLIQDFQPK